MARRSTRREPPRLPEPHPILRVHDDINGCKVCKYEAGFQKPPALDRGNPNRVMLIGEGPGNSELRATRAFAGPAGTRLDKWLVASGADAAAPRANVYLTSIIKCCTSSASSYRRMVGRCRPFLERQMEAIKPSLVIALGQKAHRELSFDQRDFADAVCRIMPSRKMVLFTHFGFHFDLLVWPHPSGRSMWLNSKENQRLLSGTFPVVAGYLRADEEAGTDESE